MPYIATVAQQQQHSPAGVVASPSSGPLAAPSALSAAQLCHRPMVTPHAEDIWNHFSLVLGSLFPVPLHPGTGTQATPHPHRAAPYKPARARSYLPQKRSGDGQAGPSRIPGQIMAQGARHTWPKWSKGQSLQSLPIRMNGPPTPCHSFQWPSPSPRHLLRRTFGSVGLGLPHAYEEPMSPVMTVRHQLRLSLSRAFSLASLASLVP